MSTLDFIWFACPIPIEAIRLMNLATKMLYVFGAAALVGAASAIYAIRLRRRKRYRDSLVFFAIALACVLLSEVVFTWVSAARAKFRVAACHTSLSCIGLAMNMYCQDYDEWYPTKLANLYPGYLSATKPYQCPNAYTSWRDAPNLEHVRGRDYAWTYRQVGPMAHPDVPLAWDPYPHEVPDMLWRKTKHWNVLFMDGHRETLSEEAFKKRVGRLGSQFTSQPRTP
ncbi:MAG: hypothetical protein FJ279_05105 [Planctomycetes bacterium]|nr:hypothetical protein [Planctomycetota bacterium]MBM4079095.1 hypothetical protein [Planctomycetota bacterium]MBM4083438.1 hypothetical protein [Planctomycetota bacterium]